MSLKRGLLPQQQLGCWGNVCLYRQASARACAALKQTEGELYNIECGPVSKRIENAGYCLLAFPKKPLELLLATTDIEGTFSCLSLPVLTGVKGL